MQNDQTQLLKVSTYARKKEISTETVRNMIADGRLEGIKIDGVQFVVIKTEKEPELN